MEIKRKKKAQNIIIFNKKKIIIYLFIFKINLENNYLSLFFKFSKSSPKRVHIKFDNTYPLSIKKKIYINLNSPPKNK